MDGVGEPAVAAFLGEAEQILGVGGTVGLKLFFWGLGDLLRTYWILVSLLCVVRVPCRPLPLH